MRIRHVSAGSPFVVAAIAQAPTVDKSGKPLTLGEMAFRHRIKQFWSACGKNLKARG